MQKRKLGRTGLDVSLLTFGCGAVGGLMTKGDPADQMRAVRRALELGVNFFDTAPLYGDGASETNVGRIFRELKPDVVLGTKVNIPPEGKSDIAKAIETSLDASLRRLGRDHVDLLQLHNSIVTGAAGIPRDLAADVVLNEVAPAFERLKKSGKIRFCGITAIGESAALHRVIDSRAFDTAQVVYNLLNPSAGGPVPVGYPGQDYGQLLARAEAAGMGTIVIRVLAGGALSGEEARHPLGMPIVAPIGSGSDYRADVLRARRFSLLLAEAGAASLVEMGIRFVASHTAVSTLQVGIATVDEFEGGAQAVLKGPLPPVALARIADVQKGFAGEAT
ncbi:MAG: aldo/keto reductase [Hyphomicrobiaceae bacterium]|nr:aldo/keto reductase [Hyphomicrobiaceae bacterium]